MVDLFYLLILPGAPQSLNQLNAEILSEEMDDWEPISVKVHPTSKLNDTSSDGA